MLRITNINDPDNLHIFAYRIPYGITRILRMLTREYNIRLMNMITDEI